MEAREKGVKPTSVRASCSFTGAATLLTRKAPAASRCRVCKLADESLPDVPRRKALPRHAKTPLLLLVPLCLVTVVVVPTAATAATVPRTSMAMAAALRAQLDWEGEWELAGELGSKEKRKGNLRGWEKSEGGRHPVVASGWVGSSTGYGFSFILCESLLHTRIYNFIHSH